MAFVKDVGPLQVLVLILVVRLLSVFLVQTWYVPDEYWQTLEVAHKYSFGYGALTWEWSKGIRSYLYPAIVTAMYKLLYYTNLDAPIVVVYLPRLFQALLSGFADYSFYKWTGSRKWAIFLLLSSWFWFYTAGRTLVNTLETSLVIIALSVFPFKSKEFGRYAVENNTWVWPACLCFHIRPTSGPLWAVLAAYRLYSTNQGRMRLVLRTFLPSGLITLGVLTAIDSYFHGSLVFTPWEFFKVNVLNDIGTFYGAHPWYWYLSTGLPAVLGINTPFVVWALVTVLRRPAEHSTEVLLLIVAALHIAVHSFIPHKEFRFILPLLPILLYLVQDVLVRWSRKAKKWQIYAVALTLLLGNAGPALYFGMVHQRATLQVMPLLRDSVHQNSSVLFMMPCHSTPLYSHLHKNVTTRWLSCEPPLEVIGETDESDRFFQNPTRWWRTEYASRATPSHIVMFDKLRARLQAVLPAYRQVYELPHTQFPEGEVSENVLVFEKVDLKPKPATAATDNAI